MNRHLISSFRIEKSLEVLSLESSIMIDAEVFDIDGFDVPSSKIAALKAKGRKLVCYFSAGAWEDWRSDASRWPSSVRGKSNGWPGEKWVDVRQLAALKPIMAARMDMCKAKGYDAVDIRSDGVLAYLGFFCGTWPDKYYLCIFFSGFYVSSHNRHR